MKFFIITLFTYYFYNILKYRKGLYMLQQNIYNEGNRYLKWTLKNKEEVFFNYDLLSFLLILLTFFVSQTFYMIAIIIFFLVLSYKELNKISKEQKKIKRRWRKGRIFARNGRKCPLNDHNHVQRHY